MKTLLLIDAHSIIHRAYHALPPLTSKNNTPTGALYGVARILLKILSEKKPDYAAAAFDRPEPTFRKREFPEYKAHRPPTDKELVSQLIEARTLFKMFGIASFEVPGFEGDDIIGTLAKKFSGIFRVLILTGDLDSLQLVSENTVVETFKKGVSETTTYDVKGVVSRFGVSPKQIPDFKGLTGDASDNIPGVRGIGQKTAALLLQRFETLEQFFLSKDTDKKFESIQKNKEVALLSKKLATIRFDAPISPTPEDLRIKKDDIALAEYMRALGFLSLLKKTRENISEEKKQLSLTRVTKPEKIEGVLVGRNLKEYIKNNNTEEKLFDLDIAEWLLNPEKKYQEKEYLSQKNAYTHLKKEMGESGVLRVFEEIEMPVIPVLALMEKTGICVDKEALRVLQKTIIEDTEKTERKIYKCAGEIFNPNSPSQVSKVLFEKMGVGKGKKKKTKTGMNSTSERALSELREKHEIIQYILEYRENMKILSTYVDPILQLSTTGDSVIHTSFIQTGTATGRLSSEKPNLQNIPQESRWAKPLRDCFVSRKGKSLVSFDYSQLELRILAHVSNDTTLKNAFVQKKDIHTLTAKSIFNVAEGAVTPHMRRVAKTLNFGVIYGMGARAFSEESGISKDAARIFIQEYFSDFPAVNEWREKIKKFTEKHGYVRNENGRIRYFSQSKKNPRAAAEFERAAINMPIQSLGADIIKLAMRNTFELVVRNVGITACTPLLTIHDELIFEISDDTLEELAPKIKEVMESVYPLSVPILVESKHGKRWGSMEKF